MTAARSLVFLFAALAFAPLSIAANVGVSAQLGTTGIGLHLHKPFTPQLVGRLGANIFNYDYRRSTTYTEYDADLRLRTIDVLLDWHPMAGGFRITGGLVINHNNFYLKARPSVTGTFTFNGTVYSVADIGEVEGRVRFRRAAPYLGIGWGTGGTSETPGWGFSSDVGIIYHGKARASLNSTGCNGSLSALSAAVCAQLESDLPNESARVEEEIDEHRFYPVVRFGVSYRF